MSKKKTTEQFIAESCVVHNNFYDYSNTVYTSAFDKVVISCPLHGPFLQKANSHLQGTGCPACGKIKAHKIRKTTADFIKEAQIVHGNTYDYNCTSYNGSENKVSITCKVHGIFEQLPSSHLKGQGCPTCGKQKSKKAQTFTTSKFILRATQLHDNKYDYTHSVYISGKQKISIVCPIHGSFMQIAASHLSGQGCPKCTLDLTGWTYSLWEKQGHASKYFDSFKLYLIECYNNDERFLKIGKTFSTVGRRFQDKNAMPYYWKLLKQVEGDARTISELENQLHTALKTYSYVPSKAFGGASECFKLTALDEVINLWL